MKIFKPETLLRKIADLAFDGRFRNTHAIPVHPHDPKRELETITFLVNNRYGYLIEEYVERIENQ